MQNREFLPTTQVILAGILDTLLVAHRDFLLVHAENLAYFDPMRVDWRFDSLRNRFLVR